ncbi:LysR family transcriptional regulator, partial [Burkholderia pseudomallei]
RHHTRATWRLIDFVLEEARNAGRPRGDGTRRGRAAVDPPRAAGTRR